MIHVAATRKIVDMYVVFSSLNGRWSSTKQSILLKSHLEEVAINPLPSMIGGLDCLYRLNNNYTIF